MKHIYFSSDSEYNSVWTEKPSPAIKNMPSWYKNLNGYRNGKYKFTKDSGSGLTIKKCVPFLDAISVGYHILLSSDVVVDPESDNGNIIHWLVNTSLVSNHHIEQLGDFKIPEEYYPIAFKWNNFHTIKTPRGYSSFITHPINRIELPFYTLSGIVDTDNYNETTVLFPFFLKRNFSGIIPKGTPIAQIIPFKRETWKMKMGKTIENYSAKLEKHHSYIINAYKKLHWDRKKYE